MFTETLGERSKGCPLLIPRTASWASDSHSRGRMWDSAVAGRGVCGENWGLGLTC